MNRRAVTAAVVLLGGLWRLWLAGQYAGWEESDYGNLAMVRGVLDGHFLHYDMNHMPGYYALGAAALALVGDTVIAAKGVSLVGGLIALGLAVHLTGRLAGTGAALLAGLLLVIQPEFALYAASSLREPVYAAAVLGCLMALHRESLPLASLLAGMAFLVRFDGALVLTPLLVLHATGQGPRGRRLVGALVPLALIIASWSLYCRIDHGTFLFWSHAVSVNVETGLGAEAPDRLAWTWAGARVAGGLLLGMLPDRIGWGIWAGLLVAVSLVPWRRHGLRRTWTALGVAMLGVWAGIGFVGQHDPAHNLYWKWLCPIVPVVVPLGVLGLLEVTAALGRRLRGALVALALIQAAVGSLTETHRQWALSEAWYRPQLQLAQWIEAEVPASVPLVLDNIPACWINRRHHERAMTSWFDVPTPPGDEQAFAAWLAQERIGYVLWFVEPWTEAPLIAPFLAHGDWAAGDVRLTVLRREDGYGWIFFKVEPRP